MAVHQATAVPFSPLCGADEPNQWTTDAPEYVTCTTCALLRLQALCTQQPSHPSAAVSRSHGKGQPVSGSAVAWSGHPGGAKTAEAPGAPPVGEGPTSTEESTAGGPAATIPRDCTCWGSPDERAPCWVHPNL